MSDLVDESYINRLSIAELRRELVDALEFQFGLMAALRDAPELARPFVLHRLSQGATWRDGDHDTGKLLQRKHGLDAVPPVSECESGAGLWWRIRQGLLTKRPTELP